MPADRRRARRPAKLEVKSGPPLLSNRTPCLRPPRPRMKSLGSELLRPLVNPRDLLVEAGNDRPADRSEGVYAVASESDA